MGELAEERRDTVVGAKDCSKGLGSRSKFVLDLCALESAGLFASGGGGGCCGF